MRPLFPEGYLTRRRSLPWCCRPIPNRTRHRSPSSGPAQRWPFPIFRSLTLSAACASVWWTGNTCANPSYSEARESKLNIIVAGTDEGIVMVEAGAQQVSEEEVLGAIEYGHECCRKIGERDLRRWSRWPGKPKKVFTPPAINAEAATSRSTSKIRKELTDALNTEKYQKLESYANVAGAHEKAAGRAAGRAAR